MPAIKYVRSLVTGFDRRIWMLAFGRLFSAVGSGFTSFYAPIFFVNVVKLPPAEVGIGIGLSSVAGFIGRILGGTLADSPAFGRRKTLICAAVLMAIGSFMLAATNGFSLFVLGNALMGMGIGLYWPATETLIADISEGERLSEAFALTRLADNIGIGIGVVSGGLVIGLSGAYRVLFIVDGVSYLILLGFILAGIKETLRHSHVAARNLLGSWHSALRRTTVLLLVAINVVCTSNIIQVTTTMPLYLANFVPFNSSLGLPAMFISALFTLYTILAALLQMPAARLLSPFKRVHTFMIAGAAWMIAYALIWCAGCVHVGDLPYANLIFATVGLIVFAVGSAVYGPSMSTFFVELAPPHAKSIYLSINSLCWATGGAIAPPLGMAALGESGAAAPQFWLCLIVINVIAITAMALLDRLIISESSAGGQSL